MFLGPLLTSYRSPSSCSILSCFVACLFTLIPVIYTSKHFCLTLQLFRSSLWTPIFVIHSMLGATQRSRSSRTSLGPNALFWCHFLTDISQSHFVAVPLTREPRRDWHNGILVISRHCLIFSLCLHASVLVLCPQIKAWHSYVSGLI